MTFTFGERSLQELEGCHPVLQRVAHAAIAISAVDFGIYEGLRTAEEHMGELRRGSSETLESRHLVQEDGFSHALCVMPWTGTGWRKEWRLMQPVAEAMQQAAFDEGVADRIRWGAIWDRTLADFGAGTPVSIDDALAAYARRRPGATFLDGPHFELLS